jgi:hypothetical protein
MVVDKLKNILPVFVIILVHRCNGAIILTKERWICDYCSMSKYSIVDTEQLLFNNQWLNKSGTEFQFFIFFVKMCFVLLNIDIYFILFSAPHDPSSEECGFPLLCSFYGLLVFIVLMVIYKTVVGVKDWTLRIWEQEKIKRNVL